MTKAEFQTKYKQVRLLEIPCVTEPPWVDGELNDPAWRQAFAVEGLLDITDGINHRKLQHLYGGRRHEPQPPPPQPAAPATRVLCCHDMVNLYVAFVCDDHSMDTLLRRDHQYGGAVEQEDCVYIWLDADLKHIQSRCSEYVVNAGGHKKETLRGQISGGDADHYLSMMAWEGRVRLHATGWTAEVFVPLERLGLNADGKHVFGLNVGRGYRGTMRTHALLPFDRDVLPGWGVGLLLDANAAHAQPDLEQVDKVLSALERMQSGRALPTEPVALFRMEGSVQDENAMIGMSVWGPDHQPTITLGRADSYDRRWYGNEYTPISRQQVVAAAMSGDASRLRELAGRCSGRQYKAYRHFPAPKPVGQAILCLPGGQAAGWVTDTAAGEDGARRLTCRCAQGELDLTIYVHKRRNLVVVEAVQRGLEGREMALRLYRHQDSPLCSKLADYDYAADLAAGRNVAPLPPPVADCVADAIRLRQVFYPDLSFPDGFSIAVYGHCQGAERLGVELKAGEKHLGTAAHGAYENYAGGALGLETWRATAWGHMNELPGSGVTLRLRIDQPTFRFLLPVLSTNDGLDLDEAQRQLVAEVANLSAAALMEDSRKATVQERAGTYQFRQDLPLSSIFSAKFCVSDKVAWHGDFHFNEWAENLPFYDYFILGRTAELEPYFQMIESNQPAARAFAREIFGCAGMAVGVASFPMRLERLPQTNLTWDYSIENTGLAVQPFWLTYQYTMDAQFLPRAYAIIREAAWFYADYVALEQDGWYHICPCVSSEHIPLQPGLKFNRDSTASLTMARFVLAAAVAGARQLGTDDEQAVRWAHILARLAPYPTEQTPEGPRLVDVAGARLMTHYNTPAPLYPVFYGNDIGLASAPEAIGMARRTVGGLVAKYADHVYRTMTRLGLYHGGKIGCENLLQSHQGPLFLFPAVPDGYSGSFDAYRARGAFEVSATMEDGHVTWVGIRSRVGGVCRLALANLAGAGRIRAAGRTRDGAWLVESDRYLIRTMAPGETCELIVEA